MTKAEEPGLRQPRNGNRSFDDITPLIVAGPPRSGTRFVTAVLDSVPGIQMYSEIRDELIEPVLRSVRQADGLYRSSSRDGWPEQWERKKRLFMFSIWHGLSADKKGPPRRKSLYIGYKTPFHERYFDFYNGHFDPVRPVYVCCIRSFVDHFLSVQARWPRHGIVYTAFRYWRSLRRIRRMKAERPDEVIVFVLDDYREHGYRYFQERILTPLGFGEVPEARERADRGAVNSVQKFGVERADALTWRQRALLRLLPGTEREFRALRHG